MRPNTYAIREAFRSIRKNSLMSVASVSTVGICLLCLSATYILSANIANVAKTLESQVEIRVFLTEGIESTRVKELQGAITGYPEVLSATYVSKDDALRRLREQFGDQRDLLAELEEANPLPVSLEVRLKYPEKVKEVAENISALKGVESVSYKPEVVRRLFVVTRAVRLAGSLFVAALAVVTVVLVSNTIRLTLFARRKEISIMKLVGATDSFIRAPFMIEGLVLGLLGAILAAVVSNVSYSWVVENLTKAMPFVPVLESRSVTGRLNVVLLAAGSAMGALGSAISLRRFMRV